MATKTTPRVGKSAGSTKQPVRRASRPTAAKGAKVTSGKRLGPTPAAADVAAAQKILRTVERKENALRKALKGQKNTLDQLKKTAATHRGTVKSLKTDLRKVRKTRKAMSSKLT
ncbi:hypothetical protein TUM20985_57290 [Mycobacterium antarcticum]|uniref:hypothetical protein n=1 Tax=unclassified Mycolicibacterium TaxID=2636767 RepID=UPI002384FDE4|nr:MULTISPECIES: hypothetical protein [unclassified Mycolicibacterium]BDX35182.1 hypothetical protein TUM20985_57290 [Mycolicibacterium sp. TUM20985]GLP81444.1 hypothetical protein TUM20984_28640 [Mycolicibacterium sp. TUM20984]